jgi:hypothetical protein
MERYINPYTNFGFKKLFGEEGSKDLLIDFLNTLLPPGHQIATLAFHNPERLGTVPTVFVDFPGLRSPLKSHPTHKTFDSLRGASPHVPQVSKPAPPRPERRGGKDTPLQSSRPVSPRLLCPIAARVSRPSSETRLSAEQVWYRAAGDIGQPAVHHSPATHS